MDLFSPDFDPTRNIIPKDGTVNYYGPIFSILQANAFLEKLCHNIAWKHDEAVLFGKHFTTKRKVAWYGDSQFEYTYSNTTKKALTWTSALRELKAAVEQISGETFNSCLLNLYHNGDEGMAWHSDSEKDLKKNGAIASLSFGAARKFAFKHKDTKETVAVLLEHGSILVMKEETQTHWLHRLPPSKRVVKSRINLTFRTSIN